MDLCSLENSIKTNQRSILKASIVMVLSFLFIFVFGVSIYLHTPIVLPNKESVLFTVRQGQSFRTIAKNLHKQGIIEHPRWLVYSARWHGLARKVQAGEYEIQTGTTPTQLLNDLVCGRVKQYSFTIVEGWTVKQLLQSLQQHPKLKQSSEPLPEDLLKEGHFYPDTYFFPANTKIEEFLHRAQAKLGRMLEMYWTIRAQDLPLETPEEALVLASIVEKEAGTDHDKQRVARVFLNRLEKGMHLQADPTVIYALGDEYKGKLYSKHLTVKSPYNTYVNKGLPVAPIAFPSDTALQSVLDPIEGDWLYFVSNGNGGHVFSKTLAEHEVAVKAYRERKNSL